MNEMNREMRRMSEREERLAKKQTEMLASLVMRKRFLDSKESPFTLVKSELN